MAVPSEASRGGPSSLKLRRASLASAALWRRMVVGTGFELAASVNAETADTQLRTQKLPQLQEVIEAWRKLSELRAVAGGDTERHEATAIASRREREYNAF